MTVEPSSASTVRPAPLESLKVIFGIRKDSKNDFAVDDARLYIVIRAGKPSPVIASLHRRDLGPHLIHGLRELIDRIVAVLSGAARGLFRGGGSLRDAISTDTDRGSFQGMRKRSNRRRRALTHARHQQFGLPLEQLQDFLFEATVVESHARKVRAVEHGISVRRTITFHNINCGPDDPHLPIALFVSGTLA